MAVELGLVNLLYLCLDAHLLALLELLAVLEELVELALVSLVPIDVKAEESLRFHTRLLHLSHLLEENLPLDVVSLFKSFRTQVGTRYILQARLRHAPRQLPVLVQLLVENTHLVWV